MEPHPTLNQPLGLKLASGDGSCSPGGQMKGIPIRLRGHFPPFVVDGWNRATWLLPIAVLSLFLIGCKNWIYDVGIGLIDTKTQSMTFLPSGESREVVVNVFEENRSFQTLQRIGDQLQMRTITFDGKVLSKRAIPLLLEGYCSNNNYAVSPDGRQIIYFDYPTKGLRVFDTASGEDSPLMDGVASSGAGIAKIHFISHDEIVIILLNDEVIGRTGNTIVQLNIETEAAKTITEPVYLFPCLDPSFSRSSRYLAYWEANQNHSIYGDIRILDLKACQVVGTIKNPGDALLANPCLSPSEQMVACVVGNSIVTAPLSGDPVRTVKTLPEDNTCYFLAFLDDKTLIYRTGKNAPWSTLVSLDVETGREIVYSKRAFNGDIFVVDNGKLLICELGF
jgi:hypothetical protein